MLVEASQQPEAPIGSDAVVEEHLHSVEKAIDSWENMSKVLEDPSEALEELTRLYGKQGNYEALKSVYERALTCSHSESERVDNMEKIANLYLTHLDQRDKGLETLHQMLGMDEGRDQALEQLTQLHRDAEEWDALIELYTEEDGHGI